MKVSYAWLNTYFKKGLFGSRLPRPARLAELLSAHAFEVEGMEKVAGDTVLDVKVLPDRAHYALSHRGIAREASVMTGIPTKPAASSHAAPDASIPAVSVRIDDSALCPRYMARRIEGVSITSAPAWLARPLERIGQQSINSVVDATNFVMYDLGQPLHAFDADKVRGQIVVRRARAGEKIIVLGGKDIELLESDLVIADDDGAIAIAGVKGGKRAEVTAETRNIIIESANFNPTSVRRTSTRTNLRSDSSKRYENEITSALVAEAIECVTSLILEHSPKARVGPVTDVYPAPVSPWSIEADISYMKSVTGLDMGREEMVRILTSLRCRVIEKGEVLSMTPPLDRLDLRIPEDIADELARVYG